MTDIIHEVKLQNRLVFKVSNKQAGTAVYFREPTVGERLKLEAAKELNVSTLGLLQNLIIKYEGDLTPDKIGEYPDVCNAMLDVIYDKSPLFSQEATISLYNKVSTQMNDDLIEGFKRWVAKELKYPDFMYLADDMTSVDFLRYIKLTEEVTGLDGFFLYSMTDDDSHLSDTAKQMIQQVTSGIDYNQADWQRAGLPRPPVNITERKMVQDHLRKEHAENPSNKISEDVTGQPRRGIEQQQADSIREAGKLLAQKIRHEEQLKVQGLPIPKFSFEKDAKAHDVFEKEY